MDVLSAHSVEVNVSSPGRKTREGEEEGGRVRGGWREEKVGVKGWRERIREERDKRSQ